MSDRRRKYSDEFVARLRRLWAEESVTGEQLQERFGISQSALSHLAARYGFPKRRAYRASRAVQTPGGVFPSVGAAAAAYQCTLNTAHYRATRQIQGWRFVGEQ